MSLELFHFLRPWWLLLIPVLFFVLWLMIKRRLGSRSWETVCDKHLLPHMLIGGSNRARRTPLILVGICGLIAILSLAGPVWEKLPQPVFNNQTALVLALDLSRSMDANDISPSRLTRARFKIADILNQNEEGQVALLVYAGDAYTVTPLTDDMSTIASQLSALTTDIMPVQGNRTDLALQKAEELLKGAGHGEGNILLVTDEVDLSRADKKARQLSDEGYRVSILGIGTDHGSPVVMDDGSFLKDSRGEIVIPVLDEPSMRKLAAASGGHYRKMTPDDSDIRFLLDRVSQNIGSGQQTASEFETDAWREQGPWLLLLLIPLAALAFRRGYLVVLAILVLPLPENAAAFEWDSLWLRADQRAKREFDAGNPELAAGIFKDPAWKGAAEYRAGDFQSSVESLESIENAEVLYNQGNALARLGEYEKAIENYEQVLEQIPDHADAIYNKELLEEELRKQQQNQQQQSQQNQEKQEQGEKQDQQQQQDQEGSGQQQEPPEEEGQEQAGKNNNEQKKTEEQKQQQQDQKEQEQQEQQAQAEKNDPQQEQEQKPQLADAQTDDNSEEQQATEQWLRRIPDDPAGLLRRKFRYQYQQRQQGNSEEKKKW